MTVDDRFAAGADALRADPSLSTFSEVVSGPVTDGATDFSHTGEEWAQKAIGIWDDLAQL